MKILRNILVLFFILSISFASWSSGKIDFTQEDRDNIKKAILLLEAQQKQIEDFKYYTNQRFDAQDKRFDNLWSLMLILLASIFGSVAYMYWDRREANRPLKDKLEAQEKEITLLKSQVSDLMNKAAIL